MKRLITFFIVCAILFGAVDMQAQNKTTGKKTTTSKSTSKKKNKKGVPEKPKPMEIELPYNSSDCIFALQLQPDVAFGPTTAPRGAGRIQDVMADKNNPNVFDYEHNSVWYKFTVPYNGNLEIAITPTNVNDDYDFLVYRYTDEYFSNRLIEGKVKPCAANLSDVDTTVKPGTPSLGMRKDATKFFINKKSKEGFVKSIPVHKGEVYYIALDNRTGAAGHTIKVSIQVESLESLVVFYDPVSKRSVDVDLLILEKNTDNRPIVKTTSFRGGKIRFVPGFNYTLYAKRDGYFSVFKDFNANLFKDDTVMRFIMNRTVKGTVFPINDIYFGDEAELLHESDTALLNYIAMFRNHSDITFMVKGYVQSYGVDLERDQKISIARAQSVKDFFVKNGIDPDHISVSGMTQNEIKRSAAAALNKGQAFRDTKVELIITGVDTDTN